MDFQGIMPQEISQTKKDRYCMLSIVYGIKKQTTKKTNFKLIDTDSRKLVPSGVAVGETQVGETTLLSGIRYRMPKI